MTPLVLVVGFLGAGKTSFLKKIVPLLRSARLEPVVVINDYQNARVDAEQLRQLTGEVEAISGDCVCCGSKDELLAFLENFPHAPGKVAIVETNGTTDSEQLIEMLSLQPNLRRFSLPLQVSIIDAQRWQKRFWHNSLEREQARTASHVILTRADIVPAKRLAEVHESLEHHGVHGAHVTVEDFAGELAEISADSVGETERHLHTCSCGHDHHHEHEHHGEEGKAEHAHHHHAGEHEHAEAHKHSHEHDHHRGGGGECDCEEEGHHHDHGEEHAHHHSQHHFASMELPLPASVTRDRFSAFLRNLPDDVIRAKGVIQFDDKPGEFFVFQKVDRFDEPQFFPVGANPRVNTPLALFIGPNLPESRLRAALAELS